MIPKTCFKDGLTIAELTRPKRTIIKEYNERNRKPQGRKKKNATRPAKYCNWFTTACWSQIQLAAKTVGLGMSTTGIVRELRKRDPIIFGNIRRTTVENWIDRSMGVARWKKSVVDRMAYGRGNMPGHSNGGRKGILARYPDLVTTICSQLEMLREAGAPITVITARGIIIASTLKLHPEIFDIQFRDRSTFKASESFVREFLRNQLGWRLRHATQASQKKPQNWEDLCERSFFRKAFAIKEEDIPDALYVNSDQTQVVYAPGNRMSWAKKGSKQVALVGAEEKRAFTLLVSIAADGTALPFQAVYQGGTAKSLPSQYAPNMADVNAAGMQLEFSGTKTYWSNQKTMQSFVNRILAPYFEKTKAQLALPPSQRSLWQIDVWSVHRSEEFRTWMKKEHPTILLDYVPGGCTSVHQPCDVGIQRLLKLSIRRSYHEDIVEEMREKLEKTGGIKSVDDRLGTVRDRSVRWIWNAYQTINQRALVKMVSRINTHLIYVDQ
jgi:hypothetical protein